MDHDSIQDLIKNTTEPLLIKNVLTWKLLEWDLNRWKDILGKEPLQFRQGLYSHTDRPQFENTTTTVQLSFDEFLSFVHENPDKWLYFDYKYLKEWFTSVNELRKHITWENLGFPGRNVEDSSFWLGSKGAHTPMHIDTYGCNIVAQIYGRPEQLNYVIVHIFTNIKAATAEKLDSKRKRWILFPPHENMQRTRIPYEESSIYSKINMFSPRGDEFEGVNDCRSIILNPGDVLIVPHRWWHFVENLEIAISINMWVDLPIDDEERVNESIVQLLVSQLINSVEPRDRCCVIVNPQTPLEGNLMDAICLTELCRKCCKPIEKPKNPAKNVGNISVIEPLSSEQFKEIIVQQRKSPVEVKETCLDNNQKLLQHYLDAILDDDVVSVIKNKIFKP